MEDLLYRLGKSKADKMQENFLTIEKNQAMDIIRECGGDCFALWFYIEGKCYGREKVFSFPSVETMARDFKVNEKTIKRRISTLEEKGAVRRIPCFEPSGKQMSNVYVVNAEFPVIPDGWNDVFPEGAIYDEKTKQLTDRAEFLKTNFGQKVGGTNLSPSPNLSPVQICPPNKYKSLNDKKYKKECMYEESENSVFDSFPEVIKIISEETKKIHLAGYKTLYDLYFNEICRVLEVNFKNRISADVTKLAFELYVTKFLEMKRKNPQSKLENPVGWFFFSYKEALAVHKSRKYKGQ